MRLTTTVLPTVEPIVNQDVKDNILIRTTEDDDFLDRTITIARGMIEDYSKISIMPQTKQVVIHHYEFEHHPHPELYFFIYPVPGTYRAYLPRPPIVEVLAVEQTSVAEDGSSLTTITLDEDSYYLDGEEIVLNIESIDPTVKYFTVTYTTGYATVDDVPPQLKEALIIACSEHYDNRTNFSLSASVRLLLVPFRRQRLFPVARSHHGLQSY